VKSRRTFIGTMAGGLFSTTLAVEAQQAARTFRIGFLGGASAASYANLLGALRLGLEDLGYVEGKNITVDYRWADGQYARLPTLAGELVRLKVDLIITQGTPAALAAKKATTTIPIVMAIVGNPVETGIVASLARPGGNITGSSFFWADLAAKRLELIKTVLPKLMRAGVLMNPDNPAMGSILRAVEERGQALNVKVQAVNVRSVAELEAALKLAKAQTDGLIVVDDGLFIGNARRVADLAMRNRLPSVGFREYCEAGGLVAYGVDFPHIWRRSMIFVDKILKGANPRDLPVEQAQKFEFVINMTTAKTLGVTIPQSLLLRADEVIQ
jgi:putative tryptophan/tyrosine transport system substrate-binding protein